jgi:hypothetical protein
MDKTETYYCPKCGKKKLVADHEWSTSPDGNNGYFKVWKCLHNVPPRRRRYGYTPKKLGPPCGLKIQVEGRNAEIDDYDDILGKLAMIDVPQIQQYLLKEDRTVHKRGIEVIYEGTMVDLVRRRDGDGVGVGLYWKGATYDEDPDTVNPLDSGYHNLRTEAAQHVMFMGHGVGFLFHQNGHNIWEPGSVTTAFQGKSVGKRMKEKMVRWAASLENEFTSLVARCESEHARWLRERAEFDQQLRNTLGHDHSAVSVRHYCGHRRTAEVTVRPVTAHQALEIANLLGLNIELPVLAQGPKLTPAKAIEIQALVPARTMRFDLNREHFTGGYYNSTPTRLTQSQAVALARIVR